ncbi:hypothetical protein K7X08_001017 [Anisodus acutangulus]|uniref:Uncharacterized protein n=1 Tax=Anisodus acutangulus TaxID=402998 RepID=A0A9Q1MMW2_9SOLA|nr:hypothetical protein K7X08_001017 [Anisodus acutangulus]
MASTCSVPWQCHSVRRDNQVLRFLEAIACKALKDYSASKSVAKFQVKASLKEKALTGLTAAALTASMIIPEVAAAAHGVTPSLNNFLLSISELCLLQFLAL